jgi:restriction endonuclease Mrr
VPPKTVALSDLIVGTVSALKALGGSASNEEIHDEVVRIMKLSPEVVDQPHTDDRITRLYYRLHWARTYLKKVGAVDNTQRGIWTLTPTGRALTDEELKDVVRRVRAMDRAARRARTDAEGDEEAPEPGSGARGAHARGDSRRPGGPRPSPPPPLEGAQRCPRKCPSRLAASPALRPSVRL